MKGFNMQANNTKERLLLSALELVSEKGSAATSVDEIAEKIGMKGPVIYKYFKGKDALLHELFDMTSTYYKTNMNMHNKESIVLKSGQELKEFSLKLINFTISDDIVIKLRKVTMLEQYNSDENRKKMTEYQFYNIIRQFTGIFKSMMEVGAIKEVDPEVLALEYTAPITILIQLCDREPELKDDIIKKIETHIDFFISNYCTK